MNIQINFKYLYMNFEHINYLTNYKMGIYIHFNLVFMNMNIYFHIEQHMMVNCKEHKILLFKNLKSNDLFHLNL